MNTRHLGVLRRLLSLPTAPFHEQAVWAFLIDWAARRGFTLRRDRAGNLLVSLPGRRRRGPRWVFAAHMDHPGFVVDSQQGQVVQARFLGSVQKRYFAGSRVRLLIGPKEVPARVLSARSVEKKPWLACRLELIKEGRQGGRRPPWPPQAPPGTLGCWDFPAVKITGKRVRARGCDDLVGVAAAVCAMEEIARRHPAAPVAALFTRAEEAGLVGALEACRLGSLPRRSLIIALETSKAGPQAQLGQGVVLRAGDRAMTWDAGLLMHLDSLAGRLALRDRRFRYVRALMSGGVCESSAYSARGYRAAGLCLPLGNYHNQGKRSRPAPEVIHLDDFAAMVELLVAVAGEGASPAAARRFSRRLGQVLRSRGKFLYQKL
jgi:endoglucanase